MGHDCSLKACPNECSNKGVCENYTCMCDQGRLTLTLDLTLDLTLPLTRTHQA